MNWKKRHHIDHIVERSDKESHNKQLCLFLTKTDFWDKEKERIEQSQATTKAHFNCFFA